MRYFWPKDNKNWILDPLIVDSDRFIIIVIISGSEFTRYQTLYKDIGPDDALDPRNSTSDWVEVPDSYFLLRGVIRGD
jgi:hypothetical protein